MKTAKNVLLQHVPIKLEPADEEQQQAKQPTPRTVAGAAPAGTNDDAAVAVKVTTKKKITKITADDSEQETDDDDDEWDEEESEIEEEDVLDEDETLQISSDEEAELEAQRIRFHELLAKSLIRSGTAGAGATGGSGGSNAHSSGPSNVESGASANITPSSSRGSSMARGVGTTQQLQGNDGLAATKSRHTSTKSSTQPAKKSKKTKSTTIFKRKPHSKHYKMHQKQLIVQKKLKQTQRQCAEHIRLLQQQKALKKQEQELLEKARAAQTIIEQAAANEERRSSVCSVASSAVSSTSQTEGCGCLLIYDNQNKLIFNCGLCDARYALKSSYIKHLSLSHKLIDEENIELQDTPAPTDIDIKREALSEDQAMPAPRSSVDQELCGNIFILQRKNLFVRCAYCDCRYANFDIFQKHLRQQHHLLQAESAADKHAQQPAASQQQQQPVIARVPLQQQATPQQQQLPTQAPPPPMTVVEVPLKDAPATNVVVTGLPTKKEIKTEIFIITELPTETPPSVGGSAGGTPLRGSPSCESTRSSNSDQPMVTIPQENGIQMQEMLRFEVNNVATVVARERSTELETQQMAGTAADVQPVEQSVVTAVNLNSIAAGGEEDEDDVKMVVAQQKQEPQQIDMEEAAKAAGALAATRAMTDGYDTTPAKSSSTTTKQSATKSGRKRKLKEKNEPMSEKKSKTQAKKSIESVPATPATPIESGKDKEQPAEQVKTTAKKRGRPKRINVEPTVNNSTTSLETSIEATVAVTPEAAAAATPPQKEKVRNKRQRKTKTPAKPKATTTTTESVIVVVETQSTQQSVVQSNSVLSVNNITEDDTKQPLNDIQHSVDELFKKLTESPKAAKTAWAARMQNADEHYNNEERARDSEQENSTTHKDSETPSLLIATPSAGIQHDGSLSPETAANLLLNLDSKDNIKPKDSKAACIIKSSKNRFSCSFCSKIFNKHSRCLEHTRIHTGEKPFRCEICSREFRLKMRLNEHKLRHRIERAFKCDVCSLALATKQDLQQHMRHHNGDRRFQCAECPKAFVRGSDLKIHERVHTGEKPYACEICSKRFRANQNLTVHRRSHTLEKNFACEVCDKRFMRKVDRKVHMRTHTGEKPFKCEICQRGYSSRVHVRAHLEREHVLAPCGLKPERKKTGPKPKLKVEQLQLENGHSQAELAANIQTSVAMVLGEHEVKAEKLDSQDGQRLVHVLAIAADPDCKLPENNLVVEEVVEEEETLAKITALPKSQLARKQKQHAAGLKPARRGRKLANVANTNANDLSGGSAGAQLLPLTRSAKGAAAKQLSSTTSTPPPQQVSVTVSMQLENVAATVAADDHIIDDEDVDVDNEVDDEAMPEKENDNSILSAAGVGVVAVAVNASAVSTNGASSTPLKAHVKNERSKITSYFTVVGQKSEL